MIKCEGEIAPFLLNKIHRDPFTTSEKLSSIKLQDLDSAIMALILK